jgi:hypothetical protein
MTRLELAAIDVDSLLYKFYIIRLFAINILDHCVVESVVAKQPASSERIIYRSDAAEAFVKEQQTLERPKRNERMNVE